MNKLTVKNFKKKLLGKNFFRVIFRMGICFLTLGLLLMIYTLVVYILECIEKVKCLQTCECCVCCCNLETVTIADITIILITFGIGICSLCISASEQKKKLSEENVEDTQNTLQAFQQYQNVIASNEFAYVKNVLNDLFSDEKYGKIFTEIQESFLLSFHIEKAFEKFETNFLEEDMIKLSNFLANSFKENLIYLDIEQSSIDEKIASYKFESSFKKVMSVFEALSYYDISFRKADAYFEEKMFDTIKDTFLSSLLFINMFDLYDDLIYTRFSIRYRLNQNAKAEFD